MPARSCELERTSRPFLTADVGEIERRPARLAVRGNEFGSLELAAEVRHRLGQVANTDRPDSGESCLGRRLVRADEPLEACTSHALSHAQHAAYAPQPPVEGELAARSVLGETLARDLSRRRQQRERDWQIEPGALLLQLRRGEIDRRLVTRPLDPRRLDAAAHALLRFLTRAIDQTDKRERRHAALNVGFDLDAAGLEADEGKGDCAREHAETLRAKLRRFCAGFVAT